MKPVIAFIFFLHGTIMFPQQFPFLTDPGSQTGSSAAALSYFLLKNSHKDLSAEIKRFNIDYSKRIVYLNPSGANAVASLLTQKINNEIDSALNRHDSLVSENSQLFFTYSKKKKNIKILKVVQKMLTNLENELKKQHSANVLNGEKLNLYMNVMESMSKIYELMDTVEENIDQCLLLDKTIKRFRKIMN